MLYLLAISAMQIVAKRDLLCYTISENSERSVAILAEPYTINQIRSIVAPIAKEYGVASVALFGSYATGMATAESDIDLKIEKGQLRSLFQICGLRLALEDALQRPVDLLTSDISDKEFLEHIAKDEVLLYRET